MLAVYIIRLNSRLFFGHTRYILNSILAYIYMTFTLLFLVFLANGVVTSVSQIRALSQHLYK